MNTSATILEMAPIGMGWTNLIMMTSSNTIPRHLHSRTIVKIWALIVVWWYSSNVWAMESTVQSFGITRPHTCAWQCFARTNNWYMVSAIFHLSIPLLQFYVGKQPSIGGLFMVDYVHILNRTWHFGLNLCPFWWIMLFWWITFCLRSLHIFAHVCLYVIISA